MLYGYRYITDIYCFIMYIKTADIYKDIVEDVETRFGTSNYELNRLLPKRENNKVIGLMKEELRKIILKEFARLFVIIT